MAGQSTLKTPEKRIFMKLSSVFFVMTVAAMMVDAQPSFVPNKKGVSAMTPEVRVLMAQADKVVAETAASRLAADKAVVDTTAKLKTAIAQKAKAVEILGLKTSYSSAVASVLFSRSAISPARNAAAILYFDTAAKLEKEGNKLLVNDGYREWQKKIISVSYFNPPVDFEALLEEANRAIKERMAWDLEELQNITTHFENRKRELEMMEEKIKP